MTEAAAIDARLFRQALGSFVTGVTIVTTCDREGRAVGLTANSFNSVSLDPPLVLWSLALNSLNLPAFREAGHWVVHILTAEQRDLSQRFASRGTDKFAGLDYTPGPGGVPMLDGCAARFVCRAAFEHEGGDHAIFVGEVVDLSIGAAPPLVFHSGQYGQMMPAGQRPARPDDADTGEFGRYFTGHLLGLAYNAAFDDIRREYRRRGLRGADYTVLASLGLGDGVTREGLIERARNGGVALPQEAIERLVERDDVRNEGDRLYLSESGRAHLVELIAVAEATQRRFDERLSAPEMALLHQLLEKLAA
ncbi:flavin reductase family protein [uncultured Sphingomonas sp.]|uniref:flavin reductase family protein n=1 Tax=uncultured Sphingomonas sp. TaxID=158754 RepID=UPI0025DC2709|nr:flavin reductase family protein [uncultured Sphingomonas sp.]